MSNLVLKDEFSWLKEKEKEWDYEKTNNTFKDNLIKMRYDGVYKFRVVPPFQKDGSDFMVQFGQHWNLFPKADGGAQVVGCPKITYRQECPICSAIDELIRTKRRTYQDFNGMNGIAAQRRYLIRVIFIDYQGQGTITADPNSPKLLVAPVTIAKYIQDKLRDEDYGPDGIIGIKTGQVLRIKRDKNKREYYTADVMGTKYEIPKDLLSVEQWPNPYDFIPKESTQDLYKILSENYNDIDVDIAKIAMSIPTHNAIPQQTKDFDELDKL